ncbi:hypothetical protein SDC9_151606 [bioreactor metagenome]|uniref:DUF3592 domain-containing protein n=1 Tax=bioreactor metagenome TaxID=1076179 RepID=A0A645ET40_9ZZZZ|nr:hypothetical protein [Christensenella sp.]
MTLMIPSANITFAGLFTAIFSGTFGLMGLIFLAVGLGVSAGQNRKRSLCTANAEGVVNAMQSQFGSTGLRAVYGFSIDGKPYQYVSNYAGASNLLVGQTVRVYYDPQNIGRVYIEEDARQMQTFTRVFTILGAVFLSIALIVAVVLLGVLR